MKTQYILAAATLALAACGSSGGDKAGDKDGASSAAASGGENESASSAATTDGGSSPSASPSASGVSLQPGEWEMKTEVVNVNVEGLPEGIANGMKAQAGGTSRSCMTAEDAKGPKPDMFSKNNPANCKSESFSWADGRIGGKTTCAGEGGRGKMVMTMDGRYSAQSIDMTMRSETDMMGKAMRLDMRISGRRIGECTAEAKKG